MCIPNLIILNLFFHVFISFLRMLVSLREQFNRLFACFLAEFTLSAMLFEMRSEKLNVMIYLAVSLGFSNILPKTLNEHRIFGLNKKRNLVVEELTYDLEWSNVFLFQFKSLNFFQFKSVLIFFTSLLDPETKNKFKSTSVLVITDWLNWIMLLRKTVSNRP